MSHIAHPIQQWILGYLAAQPDTTAKAGQIYQASDEVRSSDVLQLIQRGFITIEYADRLSGRDTVPVSARLTLTQAGKKELQNE